MNPSVESPIAPAADGLAGSPSASAVETSLANACGVGQAAEALVSMLVPALVGTAVIDLRLPGDFSLRLAARHATPSLQHVMDSRAIPSQVAARNNGQVQTFAGTTLAELFPSEPVSAEMENTLGWVIGFPFEVSPAISGLLVVGRTRSGEAFTEDEIEELKASVRSLEDAFGRLGMGKRSDPLDPTAPPNSEDSTFGQVFDLSPLILTVTDIETGRFVDVNAAFVQATGFARDETIGRTPVELGLWIIPGDRDQGLAKLRQGVTLRNQEMQFRVKNGTVLTGLLSGAIITLEGRPCALTALTDVTARKRAEMALARYQLLAQNSRDILIFFRPDGSIVEANVAASEIYGYAPDELLQMRITDLRAEETMEDLSAQFQQAMNGGIRFETLHRRKDGTTFPVEVVSQAASIGDEQFVLSIIRDVTAHVSAQTELKSSEERFRALTETMPQLVWTCDPSGECDYLSRQWVEYTGIPAAEQLGYRWLDAVHPDDRDRLRNAWQAATAGTAQFDIEFRIRRHDGEYRWFKTRAAPVYDANGAIKKWYGSNTDIDDIKQTEEHRRALIDVLAHDLKNPLTAIRAQAQVMQRRLVREQSISVESMEMIRDAATRMADLIDEMSDASYLATGQDLELNLERLDLYPVVQESASTYASISTDHVVQVTSDGHPLIGMWDRARLERVFGNILANAIKYSPDGGEIRVSLARMQESARMWAEVTIADQGIGIPATDLALIFERNRRARNVGRIRGTGLGLSGAADIVRLFGGTIVVRSDEGRGSVFTVRLPLSGDAGLE